MFTYNRLSCFHKNYYKSGTLKNVIICVHNFTDSEFTDFIKITEYFNKIFSPEFSLDIEAKLHSVTSCADYGGDCRLLIQGASPVIPSLIIGLNAMCLRISGRSACVGITDTS